MRPRLIRGDARPLASFCCAKLVSIVSLGSSQLRQRAPMRTQEELPLGPRSLAPWFRGSALTTILVF